WSPTLIAPRHQLDPHVIGLERAKCDQRGDLYRLSNRECALALPFHLHGHLLPALADVTLPVRQVASQRVVLRIYALSQRQGRHIQLGDIVLYHAAHTKLRCNRAHSRLYQRHPVMWHAVLPALEEERDNLLL